MPFLGLGDKKMLDKESKQRIIKKYRTHDSDTGSSQVQIAILTEEIDRLNGHLKEHKQDHSSRRGILKKVNERRKLLKYLQKEDAAAFQELAKKLKLKIAKKMIEEEEERQRIEEMMLAQQDLKEEEEEEVAEIK